MAQARGYSPATDAPSPAVAPAELLVQRVETSSVNPGAGRSTSASSRLRKAREGTAPALLAKSKAWKDYGEGERPLLPVLKKLAMK